MNTLIKTIKVIVASMFIFGFVIDQKTIRAENTFDDKTVEITLPSIQCGMCVKTIKKSLGKVEGVIESTVDLKNKTVSITFDDSKVSLEKLEDAITSAGYDANDKEANSEAYEKLSTCCKKPE